MICKPCNTQMDYKHNMNGPRMPYKPDAILSWRCPKCDDVWSAYQAAGFFGARARRRIRKGEGHRNGY